MNIAFPFAIDRRGLVTEVDRATHVEQMVEQVLYTALGERVNRPNFGADVARLAFRDLSSEFSVAVQSMLNGALNEWLGDIVAVRQVTVVERGARAVIRVDYVDRATGVSRQFEVRGE